MKYLILRRVTQISILALFVLSYYTSVKILKGNLSSSLLLDTIPLSDPYAVLQMLFAGFSLTTTIILGACIILIFYSMFASRAFCAWVCPINLITDLAYYFRIKLGINKEAKIVLVPKKFRYYVLALSLILSFILGIPAFESISYIGIVQRGVIFGTSLSFFVVLFIFIFDLYILERGICSYICPLGAFYAVTSRFALIKINHNHEKCTKCQKCKIVCPEKQILGIIGKTSGLINSSECISCGRCIEVCDDDALKFSIRNLRRKQ